MPITYLKNLGAGPLFVPTNRCRESFQNYGTVILDNGQSWCQGPRAPPLYPSILHIRRVLPLGFGEDLSLKHTLSHSHIHTYMHTYIHIYMHTYIHTYTDTPYIHTYTNAHVQSQQH